MRYWPEGQGTSSMRLSERNSSRSHSLGHVDGESLSPQDVEKDETPDNERHLHHEGTDQHVDGHRAEAIELEEGHHEPEANKYHHVRVLEHCKKRQRFLCLVAGRSFYLLTVVKGNLIYLE